MERWDAVVVGGGITGLAAAVALEAAGQRVVLFEASDRLGGAIQSWRRDGWLFELGPNTVLEKPSLRRLLELSSTADGVVPAAPIGRRRYIFKGRRLHPLPAGPLGLLTTPLFGFLDLLRLVREPWVAATPTDDESIADFVRRRLGPGFLAYAVGPFVSGVYAGDPERLSVRWAVPRIAALEREYGSLIRGALHRRKGPAPAGRMIGFEGGLDELPKRLAAGVTRVETSCPVTTIESATDGFVVRAGDLEGATECLVVAVPAEVTASLLSGPTGGASDVLAEIPYAPVAVVGLGFRRADVGHSLEGFGFLSPRHESLRILGCLFSSSVFPGRAPAGHVAVTAFLGGSMTPEIVRLDDDALRQLVLDDLSLALDLSGDPVVSVVHRWPRAIPQYELGHGRFVDAATSIEAAHPGLVLAGSFVGGVSVGDCAERGLGVVGRLG